MIFHLYYICNLFILSFAVVLTRSSQKRHREYEPCDIGAKKLCCRSENQQTDTPIPTAGISSSSSSVASSVHPPKISSRTTGNQLCMDPLCDLKASPKCKTTESVLLNSCTRREPVMGVRRALIRLTPNRCISLMEVRPVSNEGCMEELKSQEIDNSVKANTSFSINNSKKDTGSSQQLGLSRCSSGDSQHNASGNVVEKTHCSPTKTASKPNPGSVSCPASKRKTTVCSRRSCVPLDDIGDLFTPDPLTYVVMPVQRPANPESNGNIINSTCTDTHPITSSKPVTISNNKVTGSLNLRKDTPDTGSLQKASSSSTGLELDRLKQIYVEKTAGQENTETVNSTEKRTSNLDLTICTSESDTVWKASPAHCSQSPPQGKQAEGERKLQSSAYPLDVELDLDLRFALGLDLSQSSSSSSSEEEPLLSLDEMMNCATQPLDTQEKETSSEPSTHGHPSESKTVSTSRQKCYSTFSGKILVMFNLFRCHSTAALVICHKTRHLQKQP